ncbi:tetratricopeptide repeat protein [Trinickia violacea]|uniref:Tetratricopeptide repeat protein n=1 Tax=Trinickia violacea TaxID=2571746 RepID=A0A4P8J0I3_9BURK|nr:tetratricopeptide repeat protein [Trinickia violacea]QCP54431.1 tetratricopeptide repeat protein [Trinickia violacea]
MSAELEQQLRAAQTSYTSDPHNLAIVNEICHILIALKREDALLPWAEYALTLSPNASQFVVMRALALNLLGRHAEAADTWASDASLSSDPVLYPLRLGYSLMMAGDLQRAIPLLDKARRAAALCNPQILAPAEHLLGEAMLKAGNPRGFAHWLLRNEDPDAAGNYCPRGIPMWAGETDLRGRRVLITHQLGFGDNFLLAACVADWLDAGANVMITCDPQVHALMQASLSDCEVVSAQRPLRLQEVMPEDLQRRVDAFAPHLYATLLHLPLQRSGQMVSFGYHFRPYIQAPSLKQKIAEKWAQRLRAQHPEKKLVGLFWNCDQRHRPELGSIMRCWAARRSLPLDAINWLVTNPTVADCVHFVNLHHPVVEATAGIPKENMSRYLPGIWHFDDTAACIGQLDAVVAVDSAVANLAAMMGTPTCVPVNTSGDWRWGSEGTTSLWIKNATVLRQTHEGDWNSVVSNIASWLVKRT